MFQSQVEISRWYAISVFARQEKAAAKELTNLGADIFLPLAPQRRLWSDRIKTLQVALFPGYLFVNTMLDAETRFRLLKPRQVIDIVGKHKGSAQIIAQHIPDEQINSLKRMLEQASSLEPLSHLVKGAQVKVMQGPFAGTVGIVEDVPGLSRKLVVQIPLLGRGVRTTLSADDVLAFAELPSRLKEAA